MSQFRKFIRLFSISPEIAISKVLDTFSHKLNYKKLKEKYLTSCSYSQNPFKPEQKLYTLFPLPRVAELVKNKEVILKAAKKYLNHNFNLLGSGWTDVKFSDYELRITNESVDESIIPLNPSLVKGDNGFRMKDVSEHPNFIEMKKIRDLIDSDYKFIDWQIDFKSVYRWDENIFYKDIKFGNVPGADIKVPWELGRMQHLPVLGYAKSITNYELRITNEKVNSRKSNGNNIFLKEFQNQILDFISSNPPGFGVQWTSAMDVAIRAVNWLISYSIFNEKGSEFDKEFDFYFIKSIYDHGKYIVENLEWSSGMRGNHYLANLAGLVFIASHLPETEETNTWLIFAINELFNEVLYQFNEDGSNFEASTNYHYFSAEIVFNAIALMFSLPKEKKEVLKNQESSYYNYITRNYSIHAGLWSINEENQIELNDILVDRLKKIYNFSSAIICESGIIPQIGDNDSGQLRITNYELLIRDNLKLLSMMKNVLDSINKYKKNISQTQGWIKKRFDDFGLYILENQNNKMFIRCGDVGQKGKGGHSHNDQLSFELFIDNQPVIVDPGTYVYTPYPELRNEYRATKMHNTLWIEGFEQNDWDNESMDDLFWLKKDKAKAKIFEFSESHFIGEHYGFGKAHRREIKVGSRESEVENGKSEVGSQKQELNNYKVTGIDTCEINNTKYISFHLAPKNEIKLIEKNHANLYLGELIVELKSSAGEFKVEKYFYSPGYGLRIEAEKLVLETKENRIDWEIEIKQE